MIRRFAGLAAALVAGVLLVILAANAYLLAVGQTIHSRPASLAPVEVGLLLGTSHWSRGGEPNAHFAGRVQAAIELYRRGRIRHILASGANPEIYYNEPQRMFEALVAGGVPAEAITLDFGGRRTLDSVVRARQIFGLDTVTVISQRYHLHRALFLARAHGLSAQGYAAPAPRLRDRWRVELREALARVLALLDVYLLDTAPQVLGEPEPIEPAGA